MLLMVVDIRDFESGVSLGDQFQFTMRYENWYTQIVILGLITSREYASSDSTLELGGVSTPSSKYIEPSHRGYSSVCTEYEH